MMELIRNPKLSNVRVLDKYASLSSNPSKSSLQCGLLGTLYLTATHLIFVDQDGKRESWILHSHLASIEKQAISVAGTPIHIRCKNFCSITFIIPRERDAHDLYTSLYQISQPIKLEDLYCFHYTASSEPFQHDRSLGWNKFDLISEFHRQGVPNVEWKLTALNEQYELCETYPSKLIVPAASNDAMLIASARFRSKGRLPVLSYFYKKNQAVICRCSQPLSGFSQRSLEDEQLLQCILDTNPNLVPKNGSLVNGNRKCLYVVDTRPKINAMANRAAGKGYENENFYENIKFNFFGIENIHVMRGSLQKLIETCEFKVPSINAFLSGLQTSGWLKHIRSVLETANFVAQTVESGVSVVVHCSDGWDRTAQTCSLAALLLDPHYRTIDGFQTLIQKEWLDFGHKFNDRCGHIQIGDSKEVAPVFTQFIDAVWQLHQQHPYDFEFNERFLIAIHDHVYSCQFGTFIGNCEKQRKELELSSKTFSLWALLESQKSSFINPLYVLKRNVVEFGQGLDQPSNRKLDQIVLENNDSEALPVDLCPQVIRFWRLMYNRFDLGVHPRESCQDLLSVTFNHIQNLQSHIRYLQKALVEAQRPSSERSAVKRNHNSRPPLSSENSFDSRISIRNDSSFDSIDSPLKVVQECMVRLQMQHEQNKKSLATAEQSSDTVSPSSRLEENGIKNGENNAEDDVLSTNDEQAVILAEAVQTARSISLDWQSVRNAKECCACGSPFGQANAMFHCWCCGQIFCVRCVEKRVSPPGHELDENSYQPRSSFSTETPLMNGQTSLLHRDFSEAGDFLIDESINGKTANGSCNSLVQLGSMQLGQDPLTCTRFESPSEAVNFLSPSQTSLVINTIPGCAKFERFVPVCNRCAKGLVKG